MKNNLFIKFICSIPILLVTLYFLPFLGVCLLILRYFAYTNKKRTTPIILICFGIIILVPKGLNIIFDIIKFDKTIIPYFSDIINSNIYSINFIKFSKLLLTVGVIFLILSFIFKRIFNKFGSLINSYISSQEKKDYEISQKNDLIMKEKQEKAKNTQVIYCPYCGADNILTESTGTCKYCRRKIYKKN